MYLNKFFPILRNLGGYTEDRQTGREGLTLAGLMMFGCKWENPQETEIQNLADFLK